MCNLLSQPSHIITKNGFEKSITVLSSETYAPIDRHDFRVSARNMTDLLAKGQSSVKHS